MAYEKQNFVDGQKLTAAQLNHIEDGIANIELTPGNGIKYAILNADYTLTLTFDDGKTYTTPSIRGKDGKTPNIVITTGKTLDNRNQIGIEIREELDGFEFVQMYGYVTDGAQGPRGVGISSVKQTATSNTDGGSNTMTVTLTDGTTSEFTVKNGSQGLPGRTLTINGLEPDENGNIELAAGYNIVSGHEVLVDTSLRFSGGMATLSGLGSLQIVEGKAYHVTLQNYLYECVAFSYGGSVVLGNAGLYGGTDTGEPFVIEVMGEGSCLVTINKSSTVRMPLKVEIPPKVEIVKIPSEYLPDSIFSRLKALEEKVGI